MPRKPTKRGRKSTAAKQTAKLSIIDGGAPPRAEPPSDLTAAEMDIWNRITRTEPPDFFTTDAQQSLLSDYCRHRATSEGLSKTISEFKPEWLKMEEGASRYDRLLRMRDRESKAVMRCATKLRITNQSRYSKVAAGTAARNQTRVARPWEM